MATTGTTKAEESSLPRSATITIREQEPCPSDTVEVTPHGGRVHFENEDEQEYRIRFWKPKTDANAGIDILLPARGRVTLVIKRNDEFQYSVMKIDNENAMSGKGGGPVVN